MLLLGSSLDAGSIGVNHLPDDTFGLDSLAWPGTETVPSLFSCTLDELTNGLDAGDFTSVQLVRAYRARSDEVDDTFHAVIQWDPDSETIARALDMERRVNVPRRQVTYLDSLGKPSI